MGIRFYCPNGHKLNVKSFQAGRRGICPYCAAKFLIPIESTRKSSKEERTALKAIAAASAPISNPFAQNVATGVTPGGASALPPNIGASTSPDPTFPPGEPIDSSTKDSNDPFIEAGNSLWYVRPPSGGQYGPAAANVMRQWLSEGRVSPDSLVWREGWRDWRRAATVFPQLNDPLAEIEKADAALPPAVSSRAGRMFSLSKINNMPLFISLLIITVIILICVLLLALNHGSTSAPANSNTPSTRLEHRDTLNPSRFV